MSKEPRRRGRRLLWLGVIGALVVLAVLYARCGHGFGLGGGGGAGLHGSGTATGRGPGTSAAPAPGDAATAGLARDAAAAPCQLRVDARGISAGGKPVSQADAVASCAGASGADVLVTGDAVQGTWDQLRAGLGAAGLSVYVHGAIAVDGGVGSGTP